MTALVLLLRLLVRTSVLTFRHYATIHRSIVLPPTMQYKKNTNTNTHRPSSTPSHHTSPNACAPHFNPLDHRAPGPRRHRHNQFSRKRNLQKNYATAQHTIVKTHSAIVSVPCTHLHRDYSVLLTPPKPLVQGLLLLHSPTHTHSCTHKGLNCDESLRE